MKVKIKKLHPDAVIPRYAKAGDAGLDLVAVEKDISKVQSHGVVVMNTGIAVEIPEGHVGLVYPRSSIYKSTARLANSVGVIDSNYRGEIKVVFDMSIPIMTSILELTPNEPHVKDYDKGDRVAQLVITPIPHVEFEEVEDLSETNRGDGGFGSTGK